MKRHRRIIHIIVSVGLLGDVAALLAVNDRAATTSRVLVLTTYDLDEYV